MPTALQTLRPRGAVIQAWTGPAAAAAVPAPLPGGTATRSRRRLTRGPVLSGADKGGAGGEGVRARVNTVNAVSVINAIPFIGLPR